MGKTVTQSFNGENLQQRTKLNNCVYERKLPQGVVCPCPYMYMTNIFKHLKRLGKSMSNFMWHLVGRGKDYINGPGHITKMDTMPIYDKNLQKSTELSPMILILGMQHYVLKLYKVYINDDPELTLTYFTTVKLGQNCFLYLSRPRYHVSVYRTIGVLVVICKLIL